MGVAGAFGRDHLRLLRGRLFLQGRDAGRRRSSAWCRSRPARPTRAIPASRAASPTATPPIATASPRPWCGTRSPIPGASCPGRRRSAPPPSASAPSRPPRARRGGRHRVLALHQRGGLPGPEAGAGRLRQQQRRHLRPRLPLAHRLRPEGHGGHLGRHAGLRLGGGGRRDPGHRRQPDRRPPGVRLAHEAPPRGPARSSSSWTRAASTSCETPHVAADFHLQLRPGSNVALLNAFAHVVVTEGLVDEDYVRARCDLGDFEVWARFVADPRHAPEESAERDRRAGRRRCGPRRGSTRRAARRRSTTGSASPSTARARPP